MKKRNLLLIALLVALGAGRAEAATNYNVTNYGGDSSLGTLVDAMSDLDTNGALISDDPNTNTITFQNLLDYPPSAFIITPDSSLTDIGKNVDFIVENPNAKLTISSSSLTDSSLFTLSSENPTISLSSNLNLSVQGDSDVKAIYGTGSINISGDLGSNIDAQTTTDSGAYGLFANGNIDGAGNIHIGNLSGNITVISAADNAYGLRAGGSYQPPSARSNKVTLFAGDITIDNDLSGTVSATATVSGAYGLFAQSVRRSSLGSISLGNLSGDVTATAGVDNAYGLKAGKNITIGDVNGGDLSGNVFAQTGYEDPNDRAKSGNKGSNAYGLYAGDNITIYGNLSGDVTATAGGDNAYGLEAGKNITLGNLSGDVTATAGVDNAYGLKAGKNITIDDADNGGDLSGNVTVDATAGSNAFGLYAGDNITIYGSFKQRYESIDSSIRPDGGTIWVTAEGDNAYGMYADKDITIVNDFAGDLAVIAKGSNAYGLKAGENITLGNLSGDVTVTAGGDNAYGMYAFNDITIDNDFTGDLTVTANGSNAYGLKAGGFLFIIPFAGDITIGNDLSGTVSATATDSGAYGLFAQGGFGRSLGSITLGNLSGDVTATAGGDNAYGLKAGGDITIVNNFAGDLKVTAGKNNAYGLSAGIPLVGTLFGQGDITIGTIEKKDTIDGPALISGDFSGKIVTKAGGDGAFGMFAANNINILNDVTSDGKIITKAGGSGAFGLLAGNDITIGNNLSGKVITIADGNLAGGLSAGGDIAIGGELSGKVISIAKGNVMNLPLQFEPVAPDAPVYFGDFGAYGLGAHGGIHGVALEAPETPIFLTVETPAPLNITGIVKAIADGPAAGILAVGPMNLDISGSALVSGEDLSGNNYGYAIFSGLESHTCDSPRLYGLPQPSGNNIIVRDNAQLIGNVFLGGGDDTMLVQGTAVLETVPVLDGGDGTDALTVNGWTGTLGKEVKNWETIHVTGNSYIDLGVDKTIAPSPGSLLTITVDPGSTIFGFLSVYNVGADYYNSGTIGLLNNAVDDQLFVTGYYGGGSTAHLLLDADLSTSNKLSAEYLSVEGDVTGRTTVTLT